MTTTKTLEATALHLWLGLQALALCLPLVRRLGLTRQICRMTRILKSHGSSNGGGGGCRMKSRLLPSNKKTLSSSLEENSLDGVTRSTRERKNRHPPSTTGLFKYFLLWRFIFAHPEKIKGKRDIFYSHLSLSNCMP